MRVEGREGCVGQEGFVRMEEERCEGAGGRGRGARLEEEEGGV